MKRPTPAQFSVYQKIFEKLTYSFLPGCGIMVWGKSGLRKILEYGREFIEKSRESRFGLVDKICRVLMEECGFSVEGVEVES